MAKIEVTEDQLAFLDTLANNATEVAQAKHKWIEVSERQVPLVTWSDFEGASKLREWADEIKSLKTSVDDPAWLLAGKAAIVQSGQEDQALILARLIAHETEVGFVMMDGDIFSKDAVKVLDEALQLGPVILFIGSSEWSDNPKHGTAFAEVISSALQENSGLIIMAWARNVGKISDALRAPGVFDRTFLVPALPAEKRGKVIFSLIGEELCSPALLAEAAKVGQLLSDDGVHSLNRYALHLKRLAKRGGRQIDFSDLVDIHIRDTFEGAAAQTDTNEVREQVAYHEAGHAAIAIIDSDGKYVPEYASITGAAGFKGVVLQSIEAISKFYFSGFVSYWDFRHKIRISLGGRVAEELVFGAEKVCTGAQGDLTTATGLAMQAFAEWGFAPDMGKESQSSSNLAVLVTELNVESEARLHELVRQFLASEYEATRKLLADNRPLLDAIKERLMIDPIVDRGELCEIIATTKDKGEACTFAEMVEAAKKTFENCSGAEPSPFLSQSSREAILGT